MTLQLIPLDQIVVEENRQRKHFPEAEMEELKASILTEKGLMVPILVRPGEGGSFILVAGERRFRTISTIKKQYHFGNTLVDPGNIPAVIRDFSSDIEAMEAELHENIVRLGLTWQERAEAIAQLHKLRVAKDPRHNIGMTAKLVEEDQNDGDYALPKTYREVQAALLVNDYLDDPDVKGARSLKDANKIVSRKLEDQQLALLQKRLADAKAQEKELNQQAKEQALNTLDLDQVGNIDDLLPPAVQEFALDIPKFEESIGTFHEGDVLENMSKIADKSVSLVITDPPYGMGVSDHKNSGGTSLKHEYSEDNFQELHVEIIKELDRITTDNAHVYIFCDVDQFVWIKTLFSSEWSVRRTPLIWDKMGVGKLASGTPQGFTRNHEYILFAQKGGRPGSFVTSDVIRMASPPDKVHAAQKPVELYKLFMKMSAIPGDTVVDFFAGSGTIFHAARDMLLNPIGFELNPKFATLCRMAQEKKSLSELDQLLEGGLGEAQAISPA